MPATSQTANRPDATADDLILYIERETLTDGSYVFNVRFGDTLLHGVTEDDACALAEAMADAINKYTVDSAAIHYGP